MFSGSFYWNLPGLNGSCSSAHQPKGTYTETFLFEHLYERGKGTKCISRWFLLQILVHITKPWKTFRNVQPPNYVLQNILQHRFDQGGSGGGGGRRDSDHFERGSRERSVALQVRVVRVGPGRQKSPDCRGLQWEFRPFPLPTLSGICYLSNGFVLTYSMFPD